MSNEILKVENLNKTYVNGKNSNTIIENLNLTIQQGEFVCILGPSGCGKSTLIRCIASFEDYSGTITSNGKVVTKPSTDRIMVFQDFNQLYPWKTVEKNIQYPLKLQGIKDKKKLKEITDEVLKKVDLDGKQKHFPHELSGGMKQRVAIAKALALKPDIVLMDEPFAALDAMTRNNLQKELLELFNRENMTVIFITHNIQEAIVLGTRIIMMNRQGEICIDDNNPLPKPCSPSSPGYGEIWQKFSTALENENRR
ncbi:MAG: ABC transporter ATP-binding protein [Clostridia bacterium]|nr:ABC transporter ATP-binding protein [Clostridia bacterium]